MIIKYNKMYFLSTQRVILNEVGACFPSGNQTVELCMNWKRGTIRFLSTEYLLPVREVALFVAHQVHRLHFFLGGYLTSVIGRREKTR